MVFCYSSPNRLKQYLSLLIYIWLLSLHAPPPTKKLHESGSFCLFFFLLLYLFPDPRVESCSSQCFEIFVEGWMTLLPVSQRNHIIGEEMGGEGGCLFTGPTPPGSLPLHSFQPLWWTTGSPRTWAPGHVKREQRVQRPKDWPHHPQLSWIPREKTTMNDYQLLQGQRLSHLPTHWPFHMPAENRL